MIDTCISLTLVKRAAEVTYLRTYSVIVAYTAEFWSMNTQMISLPPAEIWVMFSINQEQIQCELLLSGNGSFRTPCIIISDMYLDFIDF